MFAIFLIVYFHVKWSIIDYLSLSPIMYNISFNVTCCKNKHLYCVCISLRMQLEQISKQTSIFSQADMNVVVVATKDNGHLLCLEFFQFILNIVL